jgi:hypothetical protein
MGSVTSVDDPVIGRRVALKRLRPELAVDDHAVSKFIEEARVTGQLEHPKGGRLTISDIDSVRRIARVADE